MNEIDELIKIIRKGKRSIDPFLTGYYDYRQNTYIVLSSFTDFQKDLLVNFFNKYYKELNENNLYFYNKTDKELKQIILDTYFSI